MDYIKEHEAQFRAGVLGPDAYPDILTGQQVIHPYDTYEDRRSNEWLVYLWNKSQESQNNTPRVRAFVTGYLVHAAGDMFGHTFINYFTGSSFELGENGLEHIVLEAYIGKRTPNVRSYEISIEGIEDFIYNFMVKASPGSDLATYLLVGNGSESSIPKIFSLLRNKLQKDIKEYDDRIDQFNNKINRLIKEAEDCAWNDFSCSVIGLGARVSAEVAKKIGYMEVNSLKREYQKHWRDDIDRGLKKWPDFSHELAKVLIFGSKGIDLKQAKYLTSRYFDRHILSMAGLPDFVGETLQIIDQVLSSISEIPIKQKIDEMKKDLLNYITYFPHKKYTAMPDLYIPQHHIF